MKEKIKEIYLIECKKCKQPYATKQVPITCLDCDVTDGRLLTRCPNCNHCGGSVTKIPLIKR